MQCSTATMTQTIQLTCQQFNKILTYVLHVLTRQSQTGVLSLSCSSWNIVLTFTVSEYVLKSRHFRNLDCGTQAKTGEQSVLPWFEDDLPALQHHPLVSIVVPWDEDQNWTNHQQLIHTITTLTAHSIGILGGQLPTGTQWNRLGGSWVTRRCPKSARLKALECSGWDVSVDCKQHGEEISHRWMTHP